MNELERKKRSVELLRVEAAKAELELHIAERLEEIERLRHNIKTQEKRAEELRTLLK